MSRTRNVLLTIGLLLLAAAPAHAQDPAAAGAAIERALRQWTEDFNAGRVEKLCDLFAPDLVANYRGQPEKSFESICAALRVDLAGGAREYRYSLDLQEIMVSGDMAAVRLIWHLSVRDRASGETIRTSDQGLDVFRRQSDGAWRIARYIAYPIEE